ncbi:helix-turn-helix transcriptional regulator [Nonomuraea sp. NPDC003804]|uniref:helix-turn-helix domain-containing protein n=1 Tax=Nonomuraea sp. NPDC003804 TaxID=3154547 RepID=UPI0033A8E269
MVKTPDWPADRFKALIDRILDETGLNKAQLAGLVGINPSQISRWTNGSARPRFDTIKDLGEALRLRYPNLSVAPDELIASVYPVQGDMAASLPPMQATAAGSVGDSPAETPRPQLAVIPPNLADLKNPTPLEAAMMDYLASMQEELRQELRRLHEKVDALTAEREQDARDQKGA